MLQEAAAHLEASWQPRRRIGSARGARLADPTKEPHPDYALQQLYSIYVHADPDFAGYDANSVFYGREIAPAVRAPRFSHNLAVTELLLLEAALADSNVMNARFVTVSEAGAVPNNASQLWLRVIDVCVEFAIRRQV